jgi:wyosine [tRNA(Phe)-imidazoG37] synthetase (radical SAM superfamily)
MATFLFDDIIFGPVKSRRLGVSLGVNLLPTDKKFCNFDCLYCECGWTCKTNISSTMLPSRESVRKSLETKIISMGEKNLLPDVITFAGNGEPSIHPDFSEIINDSIEVRDKLCENARIAVLSNSMTLHKKKIIDALKKVDQPILKLDTALEESYRFINRPTGNKSIEEIIDNLSNFGSGLILQTLFFHGTYNGYKINNTSNKELMALFEAYKQISPESIMIYTFERETPVNSLKKVSLKDLNRIGEEIRSFGIPVEISG